MSLRRRRVRGIVGLAAACFSVIALLVALPATVSPAPAAQAANAADWRAGNIIDDAVFYDSNAMNSNDIQAFLERQVRTCQSGFTCLKDYRQNTDNRPADKYCDGYAGRPNESASTIIDRVARSCGISQKVLLVLLQKEQSLVTRTDPSRDHYAAATGQGCPDTAPCDKATAGFFYQVYYAARQYEIYRLNPTWWGYQAGRWNNILYHPDSNRGCGSARVFIENQATAGLYIYTPYTPNTAALNNMYGEGDRCSSYGNRNFWRLFTDWFGSTHNVANPDSPFGNVELVEPSPGEFRVVGWAADPNTPSPISVHVYVGEVGTAIPADRDRPDVGAAYPNLGGKHGFSASIPANSSGMVQTCVYAMNSGPGATTLLGCWSRQAMAGEPVGAFDSATPVEGGIRVAGWAIDPDTVSPVAVHVYVSATGTALTADGDRPDVGRVYPEYGSRHGFSATIPASPGTHSVCAYGINVGVGGNVALGCRDVLVPGSQDLGRPPLGSFESLVVKGNSAVATGWALDPDTASAIRVHLYVGGTGAVYTADKARADVGAAYPGYGANHGFNETLTLPVGQSDVCAYAINSGPGGNTLLGCRTASVVAPDLGRPPVGNFESIAPSAGGGTIVGWALDPDTAEPITVHVYVDQVGSAHRADQVRSDVAAAYPGLGDRHGIAAFVPMTPGDHTVCVYAINNGGGGNTSLGCRSIRVS